MLWAMDEGSNVPEVLVVLALVVAIAVGVVAILALVASFLAYTKRVRLANEVEQRTSIPEPEYVPLGDESDWQAFVDQPVEGDEDRRI